jgi:hypothetical protein
LIEEERMNSSGKSLNQNFTKKYTDRKTINSNNCAKFEVNWPRGSQFTVQHTKNRLQFDEYKFRFFIQGLWERKSLQILYEC